MIMALGANINSRVVFGGKGIRGPHEIVFGRSERIANLVGIIGAKLGVGDEKGLTGQEVSKAERASEHVGVGVGAVQVMAGGTNDTQVVVVLRDGLAIDHRDASRADMAAATGAGVHIGLRDRGVLGGQPFLVGRLLRSGVTSTADGGSYLDAWPDGNILSIRCVVGGWSMAIFALHAG